MRTVAWSVVFFLVMCVTPIVRADDPPVVPAVSDVVLSEESTVPDVWKLTQSAINAVNPQAGVYYNIEEKTWEPVVLGQLYAFRSNAIRLGAAELGYSTSNDVLLGLDIDLPGLTTRYLGGKWGQLDTILGVASKYARTGFSVSYDVESEDVGYGPTFGASFQF